MKKLFESVLTWFNSTESRELDHYLSRAANAADVDRLLRDWENRGKSHSRLP